MGSQRVRHSWAHACHTHTHTHTQSKSSKMEFKRFLRKIPIFIFMKVRLKFSVSFSCEWGGNGNDNLWVCPQLKSQTLLYLIPVVHVHANSLQSCLTLCDPMVCNHQAPLPIGFSRQEYWSGLLCPLHGILPTQGSRLCLTSPAVAGGFFTTRATRWNCAQSVTCAPHNFKLSVVLRSASGLYLMCP